MFAIVANLQEKLNRKSEEHENRGSNNDDAMGVSQKWKGKERETSENIFKRKNTQSTINQMFKKNLRMHVNKLLDFSSTMQYLLMLQRVKTFTKWVK